MLLIEPFLSLCLDHPVLLVVVYWVVSALHCRWCGECGSVEPDYSVLSPEPVLAIPDIIFGAQPLETW